MTGTTKAEVVEALRAVEDALYGSTDIHRRTAKALNKAVKLASRLPDASEAQEPTEAMLDTAIYAAEERLGDELIERNQALTHNDMVAVWRAVQAELRARHFASVAEAQPAEGLACGVCGHAPPSHCYHCHARAENPSYPQPAGHWTREAPTEAGWYAVSSPFADSRVRWLTGSKHYWEGLEHWSVPLVLPPPPSDAKEIE